MKTVITKGKDKDASEALASDFRSSALLRERLAEICKEEMEGSYELSKSQYDCPNWQMLQADAIGYRRAMSKMISLLK